MSKSQHELRKIGDPFYSFDAWCKSVNPENDREDTELVDSWSDWYNTQIVMDLSNDEQKETNK